MRTIPTFLIAILATTACSPAPQTGSSSQAAASTQPTASASEPAATQTPSPSPSLPDGRVAAINQATVDVAAKSGKATKDMPQDGLIRAQVLLGRVRFSPGVVDGLDGSNFQHALDAFRSAHELKAEGGMDPETWQALVSAAGAGPVARVYTITAEDVAGPYAADVGEDFVKLAALPDGPGFTSPLEALAERFHMSQALMTALNPTVDFGTVGAKLVVVDSMAPAFQKGDVASVEVSKAKASALAYDKDGKLIAFYAATVGSTDRPSPSGVHKVTGVAEHTDYVYDPKKLDWGPKSRGKLVIKPGPNGPVGVVWIDLNAPSYGIHGTPDPDKIGKTASHGCVRLTNWDAEALAAGVKPGVKVTFVGKRT